MRMIIIRPKPIGSTGAAMIDSRGHSHGQVRLPFYGALVLPYGVGRSDQGRFDSFGGPVYV